uniref:Uncharacterized protein n=1 Tax=Proboscia inermis TaxID=420281 RepID=A0A7S0G9E1_9STRA|mmetsp:Transcript_14828/g.15009  ORF Transcript_14828/g.15009 Transcript_14828/m.15009 type:complete len:134 (+) Transcript_14828:142-543(+)
MVKYILTNHHAAYLSLVKFSNSNNANRVSSFNIVGDVNLTVRCVPPISQKFSDCITKELKIDDEKDNGKNNNKKNGKNSDKNNNKNNDNNNNNHAIADHHHCGRRGIYLQERATIWKMLSYYTGKKLKINDKR